ncbi:MAG: nucleotidyltransferase family protein [Burkholderiales bacterium]|nr:nucleotidyltransferase family protein [Burkholderiales bacterium]
MTPTGCSELLAVWKRPQTAVALEPRQWDRILRAARGTRLLAQFGARLEAAGVTSGLSDDVRRVIEGERRVADYLRQMSRSALSGLAPAFDRIGIPVILLKGTGYLQQALPWADGRLVADVDVLVPESRFADAEAAIRTIGWEMQPVDEYTEHYYREWSHELPPFRLPDQPLELDLHRRILPPTGRRHPDSAAIFAASVALSGTPYRVMSPEDRLLHACAHLFQDSDCRDRLRDLTDIAAMLQGFDSVQATERLMERAHLHDLVRPLYYAMRYAVRILDASVSPDLVASLAAFSPAGAVVRLMDSLFVAALEPPDPDRGPTAWKRIAQLALLIRYHSLRMPPPLLVRHTTVKLTRGVLAALKPGAT